MFFHLNQKNMIKKVKLTKLWVDKTPTQYGSFKTNFQCAEYPNKWISGFAKQCDWKIGDEVELNITESDKLDKEGNPYINWKMPDVDSKKDVQIGQMLFAIGKHDSQIKEIQEFIRKQFPHMVKKEDSTTTSNGNPMPNFDRPSPSEYASLESSFDHSEQSEEIPF